MEKSQLARRISVVVLTHNRADELTRTLEHLLSLPENPPIFVADNASGDNTVRLVRALFPTVCVVENGANLGAAGRNKAVECVGTEYVAFCDDDTWWAPGSLERAVQLLDASPNVGALAARIVVGKDGETDPTCELMRSSALGRDGLPGPALTGFMAGACVFRTALFRETGGYEPRLFIGGEEELVALDMLTSDNAIVYCEELTVHHHPSAIRNGALRRRTLARNAAWVAWLRLPWHEACRSTLRAIACFAGEGHFFSDCVELLHGIVAWAWAKRSVVPSNVLDMRARVRASEMDNATQETSTFDARLASAANREAFPLPVTNRRTRPAARADASV